MASAARSIRFDIAVRRHSLVDRLPVPARVALIAGAAVVAAVVTRGQDLYVIWIASLVAGILLTSSA